ncbi:MAG: Nif3-like dinuclear metal center hexameric protein, partial [Bacteroidota bacterium]
AGSADAVVRRVAICPGAAGDLVQEALAGGAQLLIGGEFTHHEALAAAAGGLILASASHYRLEQAAVEVLHRVCMDMAAQGGPPAFQAETETDPWAG